MNICMVLPHKFPPDTRVEKEIKTLLKDKNKIFLVCLNLKNRKSKEKVKGVQVSRLKIKQKGLSGILMTLATKMIPILKEKKHLTKAHDLLLDMLSYCFPFAFLEVDHLFRNDWYREIEKTIKEEKIDVIHVHDLPLVRLSTALGKKYGIPVVFDMHENWPGAMFAHTSYKGFKKFLVDIASRVYKKIEKLSCEKVDKIIVVVKESKDRLKKIGIDSQKIYVVMNSADEEYVLKNKNKQKVLNKHKDKSFYFGYTGTFGKHRGLELAIRALPKILTKIPNAKLLLVGDGPNKKDLEKLAKKLGVEKEVVFTGFVDSNLLPSYIQVLKVALVLHTSNEHTNSTIPHKIFEYMLLGKPVIVTDVKPLERIVKKEKCGIIIHYKPEELSNGVIKLSKNKTLYQKLSANGQKVGKEKYSWGVISKELTKVYQSIERR